ncbi:MAG: hypothetical protein GXP37_01535 [Chloroflexi bacterium]|nr:hypothetical protein [Chloroflexota bacterium]
MGPLEILWACITLFFVFFALVRGYARELGVTTLIFVALFVITQFGEKYVPAILVLIVQRIGSTALSPRTQQHILSNFFSLVFILIIFASYAGETFAIKGRANTTAPTALLLNLLVGLLNGYLVAGTLWYFQDVYEYPVVDLGLLTLPLSPFAETAANFLPPYVVPPLFWAGMVMVLLLFRVKD